MVNGRVLVAGVLVAAAYVKGRIDAATEEAARRDAGDALAETAATLAPERPLAPPYVAPVAAPVDEAVDAALGVEEIRQGWRAALAPAPVVDAPAGVVEAVEDEAVEVEALSEYDAPVLRAVSARPAPADAGIETFEAAEPAPAAAVIDGDFFVSGMASAAGDLAFGRVLFAHRLEAAPAGADVTLTVEAAENLPDGGVAVMTDGGFAPCVEGMTLVAAASGPGRFVARGRYVVSHPEAH